MKRFALIFVFFVFSINLWAQSNSSLANNSQKFSELISYRGGLGLFIPVSNQNFRVATLLEVNMNIPTSNVNSIEIALQIGGWDRENNFKYKTRLDTLKATSRVFINGLLKVKKDVLFFDKSFIGIGAGAGISTVLINNIIALPNEDETPYKIITSLLFSPEIEYLIDINDRNQISINFSVQYSPYKFKVAVPNAIGKWFLLPKVTCRF